MERGISDTYKIPKASIAATEIFTRRFIWMFQIRAIGNRPRIQSAVKETAEWAVLASGTAAGFIHCPFSPLYSK
jgi:hypothetical protein